MIQDSKLVLRLVPGVLPPRVGSAAINELRGGPETLLHWLETQLGLPAPARHHASRISEYATALDTLADSVITGSRQTDRWATAAELLSRRDELRLAGWDETEGGDLPDVVGAMALAAAGRTWTFLGEAERLERVLAALDRGQSLPSHHCELHDVPDSWPVGWRRVLARLRVTSPPKTAPAGPRGSALHTAQALLCGHQAAEIEQDASFRYVHTRSQATAVEFVAAVLAGRPDQLAATVICCEDDDLAVRLDAGLRRVGLPTTGAAARSRAHPVLQVLPLSLALCWDPVDPQVLLDFLTLPILPLPRRAAFRLASALAVEPGLGSSQWQAAAEQLCCPEKDPEGKLRERLESWLLMDRVPRGSDIPSRLVRRQCGLVAQWAAGRAALLSEDPQANSDLLRALQVAAGQASLLGELAESQGTALSEPQLAHLLAEAIADGVETAPCEEAAGGPVRVRSLAEIVDPCARLIWLGLGTTDAASGRWSTSQLRQLRAAGIDVDDGTHALAALRSAEARGYCQVQAAFLAVFTPQDWEQRGHPLWLTIRGLLRQHDLDHPTVLEDLVATDDTAALEPFSVPCQAAGCEPPQPLRRLWQVPAGLLQDRTSVSATELQDRLGCPLKWTFNYQAQLRPSPIVRLPDDYQLKGTFCHSVLQRVFGSGGDLPSVEAAAAQVVAAFDERLPLDAAPLAQPHRYQERQRLRRELEQATRVLVGTLASGGYRLLGLEVDLSGEAFGKTLRGSIDCVAVGPQGEEAIIDFKYGGRSKYYRLIEDGKAVQLATYAYGRSTPGGTFPAVAYLVLSDGLLYTPSGSPVRGDAQRYVIDAPAVQTVWDNFRQALDKSEAWLTSAAPVPARPLQESPDWPPGATLVLDADLKADQWQEVCRYCDYRRLCGLEEML